MMIFDNLQILLNLNRERTISLLYYFFCLDLRVHHMEGKEIRDEWVFSEGEK